MKPKTLIRNLCLVAGSVLTFQNASAGVYLIYNGVHTPVDACRHAIGDGSNPEILVNGEWVDSGVQGICDSYSAPPVDTNAGNIHNMLRSGQVKERPIVRHTVPVLQRPIAVPSPAKPRESKCEGHNTDYTYDCANPNPMARTAHEDLLSEERGWKEYIYVYSDTTYIQWEPAANNSTNGNGSSLHSKKRSDNVYHWTHLSGTRDTTSIRQQGSAGHQIGDSRDTHNIQRSKTGHITTTSVIDIPVIAAPAPMVPRTIVPNKPNPIQAPQK